MTQNITLCTPVLKSMLLSIHADTSASHLPSAPKQPKYPPHNRAPSSSSAEAVQCSEGDVVYTEPFSCPQPREETSTPKAQLVTGIKPKPSPPKPPPKPKNVDGGKCDCIDVCS